MKVLFVMSEIFYGGAEYQIRNIISAASSHNFDVFIAKENIKSNALTGQDKAFLDELHIDENHICDLSCGNKGLIKGILCYLKNIRRFIKTKKIDLVFVYDKFGILMLPFFSLMGTKVLYSERNSGEVFQKHLLYRLFFKLFKPIVTCNSDFAQTVLQKSIGLPVKKINNVVEIPSYNHKLGDDFSKKINVLVSARISPEKNQLVVIDAFNQMKTDRKIVVNFAGNVQDESYAALLREKVSENTNANVSYNFLGYVKDKESLYSSCDFVILPSFTEGTPNVVLESFARGIPILASDIPQNRVLFRTSAFLFEPEKADSLIVVVENFFAMERIKIKNELDENIKFVKSEYSCDNANEYVKEMKAH